MHQQPIKNFFNLQNNYFHKCVLKTSVTSVTSVPHKYFSHSYQMLGFCYLDKASGGQYNTFFSQNLHQNSFYMQLPANMIPLISHKYQQQQSGSKAVCFLCNFMTSLLAAPMIVLYGIHRELQPEKHTSTGSGTFGFLINMQWLPPILDRSSLKEYRPLAIKIWQHQGKLNGKRSHLWLMHVAQKCLRLSPLLISTDNTRSLTTLYLVQSYQGHQQLVGKAAKSHALPLIRLQQAGLEPVVKAALPVQCK